jgi:DNA-binding transcriptional MerR regulator
MTVHEVSNLTGVSIRTLQYYDKIGLLHPSDYSGAGYRLYDENDLEKLQQILLFRELEFPLKDIREIINSLDFDREKALRQQIELLTLKRDHINNLITLARSIQLTGGKGMDFAAFDTGKIDEYARQAKESWGVTSEYKEFEAKNSNRTLSELKSMGDKLMALIAEFGMMKDKDPADPAVQEQVKKLQNYITENYYTCTKEILYGLGKMYAGGGVFTKNINAAGGEGTAEYAAEAIEVYCK